MVYINYTYSLQAGKAASWKLESKQELETTSWKLEAEYDNDELEIKI